MHFRLLADTGYSFTLTPQDEAILGEFYARTDELVRDAFKKAGVPVKNNPLTPEILCDKTMRRLEQMEEALEACRNLMIDAEPPEGAEEAWEEALDAAGEALGYAPEET